MKWLNTKTQRHKEQKKHAHELITKLIRLQLLCVFVPLCFNHFFNCLVTQHYLDDLPQLVVGDHLSDDRLVFFILLIDESFFFLPCETILDLIGAFLEVGQIMIICNVGKG